MDIMDAKLPGASKNKKKTKPTLRFELDLEESTVDSCQEYSYIDLVREALREKRSKGENDTSCQDLLEEEEAKERSKAEFLAQYYEIKYGSTTVPGQKRKRKDRLRDLVDAGYGYDENDPFVDDSEAYDEIVPATLTTQHGGFYINSGKLNFREVSDQSDCGNTSSDDSVPLSHHVSKKKKIKVRKAGCLDTDGSGNEFQNENNREEKKKRKKKLKAAKDQEHKKKRKISLTGKDKVTKLSQSTKKMKKPSTTYAQKLVAKAKAQQMMNASTLGSPANGTVTPHRKSSTEDHTNMKARMRELGRLEEILDTDLAQVAKQATKELMNVGNHKLNTNSDIHRNGTDPASVDMPKIATPSSENLELPPDLPQLLEDKIESLKKLAKSAGGEGKQKFFSSDVNRILLGIEEGSQNLRTKVRNGMYQHIANHLPCSKDTLMKRVKKLQVKDCDQQLKGPLDKLREAVDAVMTSQIQNYINKCAMHAKSDTKFPDKLAAASTDEDEDCEERSNTAPVEGGTESGGEKVKRTYAPRRRFKWNDNLRKLLCDVVAVKVNSYERFKVREKQTPEEYLKAFLESVVKPLWPKPWMQTRTLYKESREAHLHLTLISCQKQKKVVSGKKLTMANKEVKALETDTNADLKSLLSNSPAVQSVVLSQAKSSKKQLVYDKPVDLSSAVIDKKKDLVGAAGGVLDVVASIETETSPTVGSISVKTSPQSGGHTSHSWKVPLHTKSKVQGKAIGHFPQEAAKMKPGTTAQAKIKATSLANQEKKKTPDFQMYKKETTKAFDVPGQQSLEEQFYASDWLQLATSIMMGPAGQMPVSSTPGFLSPAGIPNLNNYEAISNILGLKPEDVIHPNEVKQTHGNDKFQFKIAPAGPFDHTPKQERPGAKALNIDNLIKTADRSAPIDKTKVFAVGMPKTSKPQSDIPNFMKLVKDSSVVKQKGYSSMPSTPVGASSPNKLFAISGARKRQSVQNAPAGILASQSETFSAIPGSRRLPSDQNSSNQSIPGFVVNEFQSSKIANQKPRSGQRAPGGEKNITVSPESFRLKVAPAREISPKGGLTSVGGVYTHSPVAQTSHKALHVNPSVYSSNAPMNLPHGKYAQSPASPITRPFSSGHAGFSSQFTPPSHAHSSATSNLSHPVASNSSPRLYASNSTPQLPGVAQFSSSCTFPKVRLVDIHGKIDSYKQSNGNSLNFKGNQNR